MSMFDKLLRKGKQMAGQYVREQLSQRSGSQCAARSRPASTRLPRSANNVTLATTAATCTHLICG